MPLLPPGQDVCPPQRIRAETRSVGKGEWGQKRALEAWNPLEVLPPSLCGAKSRQGGVNTQAALRDGKTAADSIPSGMACLLMNFSNTELQRAEHNRHMCACMYTHVQRPLCA